MRNDVFHFKVKMKAVLNAISGQRGGFGPINLARLTRFMIGSFGSVGEIVNYCKPPICGTRRALELLRPLPFKLGRITRIGGSANYPRAASG
jgi:hypothetical protein